MWFLVLRFTRKSLFSFIPYPLIWLVFVILISAPDSRPLFCNSPGYLSEVTGYRLGTRSLIPFREWNFSVNTFSRAVRLTHFPVLLCRKLLPHKRQERDDGLSLRLRVFGTLLVNLPYADSTVALALSSMTSEKVYELKNVRIYYLILSPTLFYSCKYVKY